MGKLTAYGKYVLALGGQLAFIIFGLIALAAFFKGSLFGQYTLPVAVAVGLVFLLALFQKCGSCKKSYYFDPGAFKGGFSPFPGARLLKRLGPVCRHCGASRL